MEPTHVGEILFPERISRLTPRRRVGGPTVEDAVARGVDEMRVGGVDHGQKIAEGAP